MSYKVRFPCKACESFFCNQLEAIPSEATQDRIMNEIQNLGKNPYPYGRKIFKKLKVPVFLFNRTADYRIRVGNYRVLYDVDSKKKIVYILALRTRSEKTYR